MATRMRGNLTDAHSRGRRRRRESGGSEPWVVRVGNLRERSGAKSQALVTVTCCVLHLQAAVRHEFITQ